MLCSHVISQCTALSLLVYSARDFAACDAEVFEEKESAVCASKDVKMADQEVAFDRTEETEAIHSYAQGWVQALHTHY